MHLTLSLT